MRSLLEDEPRPSEIEIPPNGTSLDLLQAIYRNPAMPLHIRVRCAMASLPFERPKLMAVAQVNEQNFAELPERRLNKIDEARLIEAKPRRI
jgi:hypothetical protein